MNTSGAAPCRPHRHHDRRVRWRFLVGALAGVLVVGGAVAASARPAAQPEVTAAVGTIPPLPPPPAQNQAAVVAGAAAVAKAAVAFPLPVQIQRVYATYKIKFGDNTFTTDSAAYVLQAPGPDPVYGVFPDSRQTALGFGAIPVTATVHLTQTTKANGTLNALNIHNVSVSKADGSATSTTTVSGQVLIRLSDVEVDQVPLDVGPDCVGSRPIDLTLTGFDSGKAGPTDYNPFDGGPLAGTFDLPSFAGCGTGAQDLDPLFDSTLSGPGNSILLNQGPLGDWNPSSPNDCRIANTPTPCRTPAQPPLPTVTPAR